MITKSFKISEVNLLMGDVLTSEEASSLKDGDKFQLNIVDEEGEVSEYTFTQKETIVAFGGGGTCKYVTIFRENTTNEIVCVINNQEESYTDALNEELILFLVTMVEFM